ncbi:hypothetical protein N7492_004953 [Penicillium capsulatum]|uniref:Uncharacterized protein n=1 Tax=Penicillium capsulatum TaxID=69766 RepID=A0A9W9LRG5_9EURO|nr:hypothetical protein N7492_004953 [Penicillium capsulatum]KAJ6135940.1 hypothetical protein N7512_001100 [Penicillium capsulatum]
MASISTSNSGSVSVAPPISHEALATFTQDISRAIMTASHPKPAKMHPNFVDDMPPAPPPSPVAFAVDSNGKASKSKHEKIPSLSLE